MTEIPRRRKGIGILIAVDEGPAGGAASGLKSVESLVQSGADLRRWGGRDYPGRRGFLRGSRGLRGRRRSRRYGGRRGKGRSRCRRRRRRGCIRWRDGRCGRDQAPDQQIIEGGRSQDSGVAEAELGGGLQQLQIPDRGPGSGEAMEIGDLTPAATVVLFYQEMAAGVGPLSLEPELEPGALAEGGGLDPVTGRVQLD